MHIGADAHVDEETEGRGVLDDRVLEDVASPDVRVRVRVRVRVGVRVRVRVRRRRQS